MIRPPVQSSPESQGKAWVFENGEGERAVLEHLTMAGGVLDLQGSVRSTTMGGVSVRNASPLFEECAIVGNAQNLPDVAASEHALSKETARM